MGVTALVKFLNGKDKLAATERKLLQQSGFVIFENHKGYITEQSILTLKYYYENGLVELNEQALKHL